MARLFGVAEHKILREIDLSRGGREGRGKRGRERERGGVDPALITRQYPGSLACNI